MKKLELIIIILIGLLFTKCKKESTEIKQEPLLVYAAASLTDVITEIRDSFEVDYGIEINLNLASSGTLARQIEQGERPEIYLSASENWAQYVMDLGFILAKNQKEIVQNELVLIAPISSSINSVEINSKTNIGSYLINGRLSMGDPAHVPVGKYAQEALKYFGWEEQTKGRILPTKDTRSALMVVELGEVAMGIVYRTDAMKSKKVKIVGRFIEESHHPIQYIVSIVKESEETKDFFNYLFSEKMVCVWEKYGFIN